MYYTSGRPKPPAAWANVAATRNGHEGSASGCLASTARLHSPAAQATASWLALQCPRVAWHPSRTAAVSWTVASFPAQVPGVEITVSNGDGRRCRRQSAPSAPCCGADPGWAANRVEVDSTVVGRRLWRCGSRSGVVQGGAGSREGASVGRGASRTSGARASPNGLGVRLDGA